MAQITLTIPDAQVARVIAGFEAAYSDKLTGETQAAFMRRHIIEYVKQIVRQGEERAAIEAAQAAVLAGPDVT